jgi:hypothetical protein
VKYHKPVLNGPVEMANTLELIHDVDDSSLEMLLRVECSNTS